MAISSAISLYRSSCCLISPSPSSTLPRTVFSSLSDGSCSRIPTVAPGANMRVAVVGVLHTGHDPQDGRLPGSVRADHADLGPRQEVQRHVVEDDLVAVGLTDLLHAVDELRHAFDGSCVQRQAPTAASAAAPWASVRSSPRPAASSRSPRVDPPRVVRDRAALQVGDTVVRTTAISTTLVGIGLAVGRRACATARAVSRRGAAGHDRRRPIEVRADGETLHLDDGLPPAFPVLVAAAVQPPLNDDRIAEVEGAVHVLRQLAPARHRHVERVAVDPVLGRPVEPALVARDPEVDPVAPSAAGAG